MSGISFVLGLSLPTKRICERRVVDEPNRNLADNLYVVNMMSCSRKSYSRIEARTANIDYRGFVEDGI